MHQANDIRKIHRVAARFQAAAMVLRAQYVRRPQSQNQSVCWLEAFLVIRSLFHLRPS